MPPVLMPRAQARLSVASSDHTEARAGPSPPPGLPSLCVSIIAPAVVQVTLTSASRPAQAH